MLFYSDNKKVSHNRELSPIMSAYGLEDRAIEVRSPAEARGFFL
jgi:hypothetical protein